jgi:hypothetical protein
VFNKQEKKMINKKPTRPTITRMKKPDPKPAVKKVAKKSEVIKTPEKPKSKSEKAMKIMEAAWDYIQTGKVQRKDVIKRFIDEVGLTKAGASAYYGNIKKKLTKPGYGRCQHTFRLTTSFKQLASLQYFAAH